MLGDRIDPQRETPLYQQVTHALIHEIQRGRLLPGAFLPSTRELAAAIRVNRKTIVLAYEELIAQGWLESQGTRGTVVARSLPDVGLARPRVLPAPTSSTRGAEYPFHAARSHYRSQWQIKLDEGTPDGRLLPSETLSRALRIATQQAWRTNRLLYQAPQGSLRLREAIAGMLRSQRGVMATAEQICLTRGSQMGVFLAARVLVRPGDTVLVEALTYQPAVTVLRDAGATIRSVGLDGGGLDVDEVERLCRHHCVRAIFVTPHHQFPTTGALQPDRRLRLLELARQFGFALIEDDYDHEYHFGSQPLLPMASYAPGRVIYVGSMSKLLLPALRIGYVVAPPPVVEAMAEQVMALDSMGNTITEDAVAELIDSGEVRRHVRKVTQIYGTRRLAFAEALQQQLGDLADFDLPDGGLAFWLRFRSQQVLDRIEQRAPDLGLWLAPSQSFVARPGTPSGLRLGFGSLNESEAADGIGRIRAAAH